MMQIQFIYIKSAVNQFLILIKIAGMRQTVKEPILLAKFRKNQRDKDNQAIAYQRPYHQTQISSLQSTLNFHKKNQNYQKMLQSYNLSSIYSKVDSNPSVPHPYSNFQNNSKMIKSAYSHTLNLTGTNFFDKKNQITYENGVSIHRTNKCHKPNNHSICNKENLKENLMLYQPKLELMKARPNSSSSAAISSKNSGRKTLREQQKIVHIKLQRQHYPLRQIKFNFTNQFIKPIVPENKPLVFESKFNSVPQRPPQIPISKKQIQSEIKLQEYLLKIQQLQQKNVEYAENVAKLNDKLECEQKQKQKLISRVQSIEAEFNNLVEQNVELQKLTIQCSDYTDLPQEMQTQTEIQPIPIYVRDSFTQTNVSLGTQLHPLDEPHILQQQRIALLLQNQQRQFKAQLYHRQMFNAQRINFLQSQLYQLRCDYQQKCKQINDRAIISVAALTEP